MITSRPFHIPKKAIVASNHHNHSHNSASSTPLPGSATPRCATLRHAHDNPPTATQPSQPPSRSRTCQSSAFCVSPIHTHIPCDLAEHPASSRLANADPRKEHIPAAKRGGQTPDSSYCSLTDGKAQCAWVCSNVLPCSAAPLRREWCGRSGSRKEIRQVGRPVLPCFLSALDFPPLCARPGWGGRGLSDALDLAQQASPMSRKRAVTPACASLGNTVQTWPKIWRGRVLHRTALHCAVRLALYCPLPSALRCPLPSPPPRK